ncbi:MAG TPA: bifunctional DNA-formamidopyrimidine glycosylase/DNA-(apurinic or apyrimidinic site) lyase [Terracidiphilus sp.]|jgi:formamidopyrimidine-DNA glycosylase|nr:bifunctional DNA-formamidopyrimidine glycosylase/DNA-(apurinic or apyrimidinic site) lyase [Terracidiphilus sp.]
MPELPEVETIARGVHARVRGDQIVDVWFGSKKEPFKTPATRQARGLEGRTILEVHRTGKHLVMELGASPGLAGSSPAGGGPLEENRGGSTAAQWIVHLGMTGRLLVTTPEAPVAKHTHARLTLASGREVRFVDPRRFGRLEFRDLAKGEGFGAPGAEPLQIEAEAFAALFRGRKLAIKAALLNQTLLAGVGNIYADEGLFRAGVRPRRQAGRLRREELERLRVALREVLQHAIRLGGSSVADYVDAEGVKGFFQLEHKVYQRTGEPCRVCKTTILRIVVAGRSTHYCPTCQR